MGCGIEVPTGVPLLYPFVIVSLYAQWRLCVCVCVCCVCVCVCVCVGVGGWVGEWVCMCGCACVEDGMEKRRSLSSW